MDRTALENQLQDRLTTLKKNRDNIPLKELKTKYKKGYDTLCLELKKLTEDYLWLIALGRLQFRQELLEEAATIINAAIDDSGLLKQCSRAVFQHQDFNELSTLAIELNACIEASLETFYEEHLCLYIAPECLEEPFPPPYFYNKATNYFLVDGQWIERSELATDNTKIFNGKGSVPQ